MSELHIHDEPNVVHSTSRHRSRRPSRGRELYVTMSELHLVATGRLEITCVSTIPEFRNIEDKFADVRNDTVIGERILLLNVNSSTVLTRWQRCELV